MRIVGACLFVCVLVFVLKCLCALFVIKRLMLYVFVGACLCVFVCVCACDRLWLFVVVCVRSQTNLFGGGCTIGESKTKPICMIAVCLFFV